MNNDSTLLQRYTQTRDVEAFAGLVSRHANLAYSAALRVTGNAHDAEDIAQECFMALAREPGAIRVSLPGWLHSLAVSRAKDLLRRNARRARREAVRMTPSGNDEPQWADIAPHVDEAVQDLPEELREVVVLHFLQGRTQAEVAEQFGVNQSTVSRRIEKGVETLRERLRQAGVGVAGANLVAALSTRAVEAAPASLVSHLTGKAALSLGTAAAAGHFLGWVAAVVALGAVLAVGGYAAHSRMDATGSQGVAMATTTTLVLPPSGQSASTTVARVATTTTVSVTTTTARAKATPPVGEAAEAPADEGGGFWVGPRPSKTKLDLARQADEDKDYARAIELYGEFIIEYPRSSLVPFAQYNIAWDYRNLNDREKALAAYRKLLDDYPASKPAEWAKIEMKAYERQAGKEKK